MPSLPPRKRIKELSLTQRFDTALKTLRDLSTRPKNSEISRYIEAKCQVLETVRPIFAALEELAEASASIVLVVSSGADPSVTDLSMCTIHTIQDAMRCVDTLVEECS